MNFDLPGVYAPRRRDPKAIQRKKAIDRFMEIYHEETSWWTRLVHKFGYPLVDSERDTRFTRYLDTVKRWWFWQIEPGSTSIVGRIARLLGFYRPLFVVGRHNHEDRAKLQAALAADFASAGIVEIDNAFDFRSRHVVRPHSEAPGIYYSQLMNSDGEYGPARLVNSDGEEVDNFGDRVYRNSRGELSEYTATRPLRAT